MSNLKKHIIDIAKKNQLFRSTLRFAVKTKHSIYYKKYCMKYPVKDNLIVFESYMGRNYACSPKALYEAMLKDEKFKNFEFVWFFKDIDSKTNIENLKRATLIQYGSKDYYKYYSQAKCFISNSRIQDAIKKRKGQIYVQTWHGTPLKRLGYDLTIEGGNALNSLKDMLYKYKVDAQRYDYLLSPSKFTSEKLTSCFNLKENNPNTKIIEEGYPRNDFLYTYNDTDVLKIKKMLGIENDDRKIILYAPTWRDNQHTSGLGYTYKTEVDFDYLQKSLSSNYIILFRAHYFVANKFDFEKYKGFIYDVSKFDDINELYIISDILITDYSSVFFDYANLKRPMIFHMYDLDKYENELRGFYIDLNELPGSITTSDSELVQVINNIDESFVYDDKYKKFNEKFNYLDDGNASKRVLDKIFS